MQGADVPLVWVLGILVTVILALAGALYKHVKECREVRATLATIATQVAAMAAEIGSHDTGLRGAMHRLRDETRQALMRLDK